MVMGMLGAMGLMATACAGDGATAPSSTTLVATTDAETTSTSAPPPASSAPAVPTGCTGELEGPVTEQYRSDVAADDPNLLSLDVYRRPDASGCPVIIWVHGGGWRRGDKVGQALDNKLRLAGDMGAVLVSVNYRLVNDAGDVVWPVMGNDVAAAVAWVLDHADDLGIDPGRVVLMGHSAGAHLVAIVSVHPDLLAEFGVERSEVQCVVALDGAAYEIADEYNNLALYTDAFTDDPDVRADASPTVQALAHPDDLPDTLVVTRGTPVRIAEATAYADAVAASGATTVVVNANPYNHMEANSQLGEPGDELVTPPTRDFLEACFA